MTGPPPIFEQSARVQGALRQHLGQHQDGQHRVVLLTDNGSLLIVFRSRCESGTMSVTSKTVTPPHVDWEPSLIRAGLLAKERAA